MLFILVNFTVVTGFTERVGSFLGEVRTLSDVYFKADCLGIFEESQESQILYFKFRIV